MGEASFDFFFWTCCFSEKLKSPYISKMPTTENDNEFLDASDSVIDGNEGGIKRQRVYSGDADARSLSVSDKFEMIMKAVADLSEQMNKVLERVETMEEKIERVDERLKLQQNEVIEVKEDVKAVREEVCVWKKRVELLEGKLIDQEARGRRNNLVFHGVPEKGEAEDCMKMVKELVEGRCGVKGISIERAHRIPTGRRPPGGKPRPLICKVLDFQNKQRVMKERKRLPQGVYVSDDLPREVRDARQRLKLDLETAKRSGKQAWIAYPARLIVDGMEVKAIQPVTELKDNIKGNR